MGHTICDRDRLGNRKSDDESQRITELEEADQKLRFEYEQNVSTLADFDEMTEWLFAHSIGLAESCLMGLAANYHSGLTPLEMSKQSHLQPSTIGGCSPRVKTVSMALHRLESKYLAKKVREGKTYRYFPTQSGLNDLVYHREEREKMKQRIYVDRGLSLQHLLDRRKVIETEKLMLQYQMGARRRVRGFEASAVDVMKWCLDLAKTILVMKHALINAGNQKLRSEAIAQAEQCLVALLGRQRAVLFISLINRFSE